MVKNHLKSLYAPRTWKFNRKETAFIAKPSPGAHSYVSGMPISLILKNDLGLCKTSKEVRYLLTNSGCLVDGKVVKDPRYIVGFMSVISLPLIKKHYRVVFSIKGVLAVVEITESEAKHKICQIIGKKILPHGVKQINTRDARSFLVKDLMEFKTSDSIVLELPSQKVIKKLECEEGACIMLVGGKHLGTIGTLDKIEDNKIFFTAEGQTFETLKKFAFIIGKKQPELKVRD